MTCPKNKIDSNIVGLSYAEESCIGVLPDNVADSGDQAGGVWYPLDPNGYSDFGPEVATTERAPINASRQRRKGVVTDVEASAGFNQDLTATNLSRLMQGFFFADAHERASSNSLNGADANSVTVSGITGGTSVVSLAAGGGAKFNVGEIVSLAGFASSANNVVAVITGISTDDLTLDASGMVDDSFPAGTIEVVGFEYSDLQMGFADPVVTLTSATGFASQDYQVGEWIYIGGDATAERFSDTLVGFARVEAVAANTLTLKETTFTAAADTGAGKTIRVFYGRFLRNEKTPALIKRRSYQLERTLGQDANGTMSEVVIGAVPSSFALTLPTANKLTAELSFVGIDDQSRSGADGLKPGDRTATLDVFEDTFNSSEDIVQQRLYIHGTAATPTSVYGYIMEANITIDNGISGNKALGVLGNFDLSAGDFVVSGSASVYFKDIATRQSVRNNADVGMNTVLAKENKGMVFDVPLMSIGGGRLNVEKDAPIMLPLTTSAAENDKGYTASQTIFPYLPDIAMP